MWDWEWPSGSLGLKALAAPPFLGWCSTTHCSQHWHSPHWSSRRPHWNHFAEQDSLCWRYPRSGEPQHWAPTHLKKISYHHWWMGSSPPSKGLIHLNQPLVPLLFRQAKHKTAAHRRMVWGSRRRLRKGCRSYLGAQTLHCFVDLNLSLHWRSIPVSSHNLQVSIRMGYCLRWNLWNSFLWT